MKCPLCGCPHFFVKDPEDEFETYSFTCPEGCAIFDAEIPQGLAVEANTEVFCDRCSWHGPFSALAAE